MALPLFYAPVRVVAHVDVARATASVTLEDLIVRAGLRCKASGSWTSRLVHLMPGSTDAMREPGDRGAVAIGVPAGLSPQAAARHAVGCMAYAVMDLVARESIRGAAWARPARPPGVAPSGMALSNAERQRRYVARQRSVTRPG